MDAWVTGYDQSEYKLPSVLKWEFSYALGSPCDSFEVRCLWKPGEEKTLAGAVRFYAEENGTRVFTGVVDEYCCIQDSSGSRLELSGRGMQALLLDNEALPVEYGMATADDILLRHVTPYGIALSGSCSLGTVANFSVEGGQSEWNVVHDFVCYHNGIVPRFNREGQLILSDWDSTQHRLDDKTVVTALRYGQKRYGVLSQVVVQNKTRGVPETVDDTEFQNQGGLCRRVVNASAQTTVSAMRYSGEYQLRASRTERETCEITVAQLFAAWPGELVTVERTGFGGNGTYRVRESTAGVDENGTYTRLVLGPTDILI